MKKRTDTQNSVIEALLERVSTEQSDPVQSVTDLEALLTATEAQFEVEAASRFGRIRAWPTIWRRLIVISVALFIALAFAGLSPRPDLGHYPPLRLWGFAGLLSASVIVGFWRVLRPLIAVDRYPHLPHVLVAIFLAALALLATLPAPHPVHPSQAPGVGYAFVESAIPCFITVLGLAIPIWFLSLAFDRNTVSWMGEKLVLVATAALAANLALHLHCPITSPLHLWASHLGPALLLVGVTYVDRLPKLR